MIVLLAIMFFFHVSIRNADWMGALLVLFGSVLPFIGLGLIGAVLPLISTERGAQATQIVQGVLLLVSGVYYPVSVLPIWLRWFSYASPATYTLQASRAAILQGRSMGSVAGVSLELLLSGFILVPLGLWIFTAAERWAMHRGTLKRNG